MSFESLKDHLKNPEDGKKGLNSSYSGFYEFGHFRLDATKRLLLREGVVVPLTPKAFDVLLLLVSRQGHVVGKDELLRHVWPDTIVEENNLNVNVSLLRKTLGEKPNDHQFIVTVPGRGYQFVAEVRFISGEEAQSPKLSNSAISPARKFFIADEMEPHAVTAIVSQTLRFDGETDSDVLVSILKEEEPPALDQDRSVQSHGPERIVRKALHKSREERYQTVGAESLSQKIRRNKLALALTVVALVLAAAGAAYVAHLMYERPGPSPQPPQRSLSRLTFDVGLQSEPTWSPDGHFIAYSSDKGGNFDIWVQPVGGGDAVQVTRSPAHDWQPDWSPDGSEIVFRSERDSGGLYTVPVLGGHEQKISPFGYDPRWSPDGTKILFSNHMPGSDFAHKVYVVPLDGNAPREVQSELLADFALLRSVVWHPDGQRISLVGERKKLGFGFWTVPLTGHLAVKSELDTEVERQFGEAGFSLVFNYSWEPSGRAIYFEGVSREVRNLWKVTIDPQTLRWIAGPERLTTGSGDADLALSPDGKKLAFTARTESTRAWSLPFDARAGKIKGEGQPVTASGINPEGLNLSRDGKKLLYIASRAGTNRHQLWLKSLEDGKESLLTVNDIVFFSPAWSRNGTRVAYRGFRPATAPRDNFLIAVLPAEGGDEQVIASGADDLTFDWSTDGQWILATTDRQSPRRWGVICLYPLSAAPHAETQMRVITSHPEDNLFQAHFSPDDRWVCFLAIKAGKGGIIYVVPASGGEWTRITEDNVSSDKPYWSPDGKTIYYLSNRVTGFYNVWGVRFDLEQGKPVGEPFRVTSFNSPGKMVWPNLAATQITLSGDRLVLPITEVTGNIWVLDGVDR